MMYRSLLSIVVVVVGLGCQSQPDKQTIAGLRDVEPDLSEVHIDDSLVKAMASYRHFLNQTPAHTMAPEAMRRLADLQIEKEYGVIGDGGGPVIELPAPADDKVDRPKTISSSVTGRSSESTPSAAHVDVSEAALEARATALGIQPAVDQLTDADLPQGSTPVDLAGPEQAIETYKKILADYPWYERNDQVLYQMARAYDELAQPDAAMKVAERLVAAYPGSKYVDEVFFRRGEYYFVRKKFLDAEEAYLAVVVMGLGVPSMINMIRMK